MLPTIRAVLFTSVVLANAGWVHANPAKIHDQVVKELNQPAGEASGLPELKRAEQEARAALQRATDAQRSSDPTLEKVAPVFADTALEWALLRKELIQLANLQAKVRAAQQRLTDAIAALKREQAYLEETEARRGRALAQLEQLQAARKNKPSSPANTTQVPAPVEAPKPQSGKTQP